MGPFDGIIGGGKALWQLGGSPGWQTYLDAMRKRDAWLAKRGADDVRPIGDVVDDPRFTGTGPALGMVSDPPVHSSVRPEGNLQGNKSYGGERSVKKDDDDWFKKMMQLSFMQSMMPEREKYTGTSVVRGLGDTGASFYQWPTYDSPFPRGTV